MVKEIRIKTMESLDGKALLYIIARDDGLFRYSGEKETEEDGEIFWEPAFSSGFYETPEAAEEDARNEVPWLKSLK